MKGIKKDISHRVLLRFKIDHSIKRYLVKFPAVSATGVSKDEYIDNVAKEIMTKIPAPYDINKVKKNFTVAVTPTAIVLFQELEMFNGLIETITRTLNQLIKVGRRNVYRRLIIYTLLLTRQLIRIRTVSRIKMSCPDFRLSPAKSEWTRRWRTFPWRFITVPYPRNGPNWRRTRERTSPAGWTTFKRG